MPREGEIGREKVTSSSTKALTRTDSFADALLEPSDEEVLGYSESEEEEEEEEEGHDLNTHEDRYVASPDGKNQAKVEDEGWGASKKDYYNADTIQTEEDAQMEEQEARNIQQKRLKKMTDADFGT